MKRQGMLIVLGLIFIFALGFLCLPHRGARDVPPVSSGDAGEDVPPQEEIHPLPAGYEEGGVFGGFERAAYTMLQQMTLEEKVGQLLLGRFPEVDALEDLQRYHLGGLILFEKDFAGKSPEEVRDRLEACRQVSKIPLILSTDEEGGSVIRISRNPKLAEKPFLSPQKLYNKGGLPLIREDAKKKGALLKSLGINVNLAPVADVSTSKNDYIYNRTLGRPAGETSAYVVTVVKEFQKQGVSAVLKHFPGYGGNADTHKAAAVDQRTYSQLQSADFLPFQAGIRAGAYGVLVAHNIVSCMDEELPASLSPEVHRILREALGFTGVILTDDLAMDAISNYRTERHPAVQAVLAGNDMLIISDYADGYRNILEAVEAGSLPEERVDKAAYHVLKWKYALGLMNKNL